MITTLENQLPAHGFEVVVSKKEDVPFPFHHQIKAHYYTPYLKWLDVIEIDILESTVSVNSIDLDSSSSSSESGLESGGGRRSYARALSLSSSFVPAIVPLAPFLAIFCAWLPFFDHGANFDHLMAVQNILQAENDKDVVTTLVHPGAKLSLFSFAVVTVVTLITLCITVLNIFANPHFTLNLLVTIFCVLLTILSILTCFNGFLVCLKDRKKKETGTGGEYYDMY